MYLPLSPDISPYLPGGLPAELVVAMQLLGSTLSGRGVWVGVGAGVGLGLGVGVGVGVGLGLGVGLGVRR